MFELILNDRAIAQLERLDKSTAQRILEKLQWLTDNFEEVNPQTLTGRWTGTHKLRIGPYRAIYVPDRLKQTITVLHIGHRSDVYKHSGD